MARKLVVEIVGDASSLDRALGKSTRELQKFDRSFKGTVANVDSGFSRLQKVAAGGFIGGAALAAGIQTIRSLTAAATESEAVLGQTQVALQNAGLAWETYGRAIDQAVTQQSKFGFDDEELLKTFSLFVRSTRDVSEALRRNEIAMDVSRARNIDLAAAAALVQKASIGQAGALRRLGIDVASTTDGVKLLAQLEAQFAGAAEDASTKAVGAQDRLAVSVENLQEKLGSVLLPTISEVAVELSEAADFATELVGALGELGDVKIPVIEIPISVLLPSGGTISSLAGKAALGSFSPALLLAKTINDVFFADEGDIDERAAAKQFEERFTPFLEGLDQGQKNVAKKVTKTAKEAAAFGEAGFKPLTESLQQSRERIKEAREARARVAAEAAEAAAQARSDQFENLISSLELGVDRAAITRRLDDDLDALTNLKKGLQAQVKAGVDVVQAQSQLAAVTGQIADKQREIREAARQALEAQQFRALGLDAQGELPIPKVENLRKQFAQLTARLSDSDLKLGGKLKKQFEGAGGLLGSLDELEPAVREKIREIFQTVRQAFDKEASDGPLTKTQALSPNKILDGLGLTRDLEKELRARLSGFNTAGMALAVSGGDLSSKNEIVVQNNNTITLDGEVVGRNVTRSQQKQGRRNPRQKQGMRGGS